MKRLEIRRVSDGVQDMGQMEKEPDYFQGRSICWSDFNDQEDWKKLVGDSPATGQVNLTKPQRKR
jgi:hypothetical protein